MYTKLNLSIFLAFRLRKNYTLKKMILLKTKFGVME